MKALIILILLETIVMSPASSQQPPPFYENKSDLLIYLDDGGKAGRIPEGWDGHASERIVDVLRQGIVRR